jgi:hypothetical protein
MDIRSLARKHTELCIRVLVNIAASKTAPEPARVASARELLDRGWGKAATHVVGEDGGDIKITIRQIIEIAGQSEPITIEHDDETPQLCNN